MAAVSAIGRAAKVERSVAPVSEATRDLYERFSAQIYGYCLHQLGSREEAEDAVQTTFMNAFRGLRRGIVPKVESAWLFKIAHNVCLSRRRSTWRRGRVEAPNNLEVLQEVVPAREQLGDELMRLQDVLEQMPESQRRAILLREWQGLSYREIADELQISQSAVETLIFRARRALAAGLELEPERPNWRRRARHGVDAGGLLAALKALLTGGSALKVAATIAVATTAAVAVSDGHHHAARHSRVGVGPRSRGHSPVTPQSGSAKPSFVVTSTPPEHAARAHPSAKPQPRPLVTPAPASSTAGDASAPVTRDTSSSPATSAPNPERRKADEAKKNDPPAVVDSRVPTPPPARDKPVQEQDKHPVVHDPQSVPPPQPSPAENAQPSPSANDNGGHRDGQGSGSAHK